MAVLFFLGTFFFFFFFVSFSFARLFRLAVPKCYWECAYMNVCNMFMFVSTNADNIDDNRVLLALTASKYAKNCAVRARSLNNDQNWCKWMRESDVGDGDDDARVTRQQFKRNICERWEECAHLMSASSLLLFFVLFFFLLSPLECAFIFHSEFRIMTICGTNKNSFRSIVLHLSFYNRVTLEIHSRKS